MSRANPTQEIDVSFNTYLQDRKAKLGVHMEGNVPDYAYSADYEMQQKIRSTPGFYQFTKAYMNTMLPRIMHQKNLNSIKVGPTQFPEIYQMYVDCARTLGIGVPTVYIEENLATLNAYAYAFDDGTPLSVITSAMVERFTPDELRTVVGHECGHIQNNHTIYKNAFDFIQMAAEMTIPGVAQVIGMISTPLQLALQAWSRAAEVTADRAGFICANNIQDFYSAEAKLFSGGMFNQTEINIDAILKQYDIHRNNPTRIVELFGTHPSSFRRILACKAFEDSQILYEWRPEWKDPEKKILLNKQELDARCRKYIGVLKSEKRRGA